MLIGLIEISQKLCFENDTILADVVAAHDCDRGLPDSKTTCEIFKQRGAGCITTFGNSYGYQMDTRESKNMFRDGSVFSAIYVV